MKIVIVSGGQEPSEKLLNKEISEADIVVCADSGANILFKHKIIPNIIVGDLDSICEDALEYFENTECDFRKYSRFKDYTDTELALDICMELGAKEITLLGCTGKRMDHFLGNLGLLIYSLEKGIHSRLVDDYNEITIYDKSTIIYGKKGELFSIQAYSDKVKGLSIYGAKYKLEKYNLKLGEARTISNVFQENQVKIDFVEGRILVIRTNFI